MELPLVTAARATGIEARLRQAGKVWFALEPAWRENIRYQPPTAYEVVFWLNSEDNLHTNRPGWYTVEELDQWIAGTGPVLL